MYVGKLCNLMAWAILILTIMIKVEHHYRVFRFVSLLTVYADRSRRLFSTY